MGRKILVINGHPDPAPARLCAALAAAYADAATKAGHAVTRLDIAALEFPLLRHSDDFQTPPQDAAIIAARAAITAASHLVFVYPLWLGGAPALLKAFIEQVSRDGFALAPYKQGFPEGRLKGKTARIIVTMGMPAFAYRLLYGAHGVKAFNRSILNIAGIKPIATTYVGSVGSQQHCLDAIAAVASLGARGA